MNTTSTPAIGPVKTVNANWYDKRFLGTLMDVISLLKMAKDYKGDGYPVEAHDAQRFLIVRAAMFQAVTLLEAAGNICMDMIPVADHPNKFDDERPMVKVAVYVSQLGRCVVDPNHDSWARANSLCLFRNSLAHPKDIRHDIYVNLRVVGSEEFSGEMDAGNSTNKNRLRKNDSPQALFPVSPLEWRQRHVVDAVNIVLDFLRFALTETMGLTVAGVYTLLADSVVAPTGEIKPALREEYAALFAIAPELGLSVEFMFLDLP